MAELRARWKASLAVAVLVGVGMGLVMAALAGGRRTDSAYRWTRFADELGVVPEPRVPFLAVVLLVPAAVLVANLVAAIPAAVAAGTRPVQLLRSE